MNHPPSLPHEPSRLAALRALRILDTPREYSFRTHAIAHDETFVIPEASNDSRFRNNPLLVTDLRNRFHANHPLHGPDGHHAGTLGAIDCKPRGISERQRGVMGGIAAPVERELNLAEPGILPASITALCSRRRRSVRHW